MWIQIITFLIVFFTIPAVVLVYIKLNKSIQKIEVTPNQPIIVNWARTQFTNGYFLGILKKQIPRKNKTTLFEFYAFDVEQGENIPRPTIQSVVVGDKYIKRSSSGKPSSYREIIQLVGRNPDDLPEEMRDTLEGEWLTKEGQKAWILSTFGKQIQSGDEAIAEAMNDYARGNIAKGTLATLKEENAQIRKIQQQRPEQNEERK